MRYCHLKWAHVSTMLLGHTLVGSTDPVEGRRPATELVKNDKTPGRALFQYQAGLNHLDHERRSPSGQLVRGYPLVSTQCKKVP